MGRRKKSGNRKVEMEVQVMDVIIIIDFTWASSWD
jgi:hypothetical protein